MTARLPDEERIDWIALARAPRVGPVSFFQLLTRFGTPADAIREMPSIKADRQAAERELKATRNLGGDILSASETGYPDALTHLDPPPPVVSVRGKTDLFAPPAIALVGARDASVAGRKLARQLAKTLGEAGFITVSGLARGIDGEVHAASLKTGTIAVVAGGLDQIYPPQHRELYEAIAEDGLIVSERTLGHRATARDFPRRNRIITGLAAGTVVVEAAERSGSLISARMAGEQGREVMAVPGSPLDPRAAGTNRLLRNGATLVRHAGDVIEAVSAQTGGGNMRVQAPLPFESGAVPEGQVPEGLNAQILEALSPTPMPIAEIARGCGCSARQCAAVLMELELEGQALTHAGGLASRT